MAETTVTQLQRYSPGAFGAMVEREHGAYVHAADVEAVLRELQPHILDRQKIALAIAMIERLR